MKLRLIGTGRAASALAPRWVAAGHEVRTWSRRDGELAAVPAAEVVVLAVPDGAIEEVARQLAQRPHARDELWLHLSGVHPADILRVAGAAPHGPRSPRSPRSVACLHPLVALAAGADPSGAIAGIEGEPEAVAVAEVLARAAGLVPHPIPAERALYHAAAVTVAGHATALFAQAMSLLEGAGFTRDDAQRALQPLFASAAANLTRGAPEAVITGPASRGDAATIVRHLTALQAFPRDVSAVYRALARTAVALSAPRLAAEQLAELMRALAEPEADS